MESNNVKRERLSADLITDGIKHLAEPRIRTQLKALRFISVHKELGNIAQFKKARQNFILQASKAIKEISHERVLGPSYSASKGRLNRLEAGAVRYEREYDRELKRTLREGKTLKETLLKHFGKKLKYEVSRNNLFKTEGKILTEASRFAKKTVELQKIDVQVKCKHEEVRLHGALMDKLVSDSGLTEKAKELSSALDKGNKLVREMEKSPDKKVEVFVDKNGIVVKAKDLVKQKVLER